VNILTRTWCDASLDRLEAKGAVSVLVSRRVKRWGFGASADAIKHGLSAWVNPKKIAGLACARG